MDQDYYESMGAMIPVEGDREDKFTYDNYGWTEHISRKWGQWYRSPDKIVEQLNKCGFDVGPCGNAN